MLFQGVTDSAAPTGHMYTALQSQVDASMNMPSCAPVLEIRAAANVQGWCPFACKPVAQLCNETSL